MAITKNSSIHPVSDVDKVFVINFTEEDFSKPSNSNSDNPTAIVLSPPVSRAEHIKRQESATSLTPSTVEVIMNGGHFGLAGPRAYEAAMWCGLGCFVVCGMILLGGGLYTAIQG